MIGDRPRLRVLSVSIVAIASVVAATWLLLTDPVSHTDASRARAVHALLAAQGQTRRVEARMGAEIPYRPFEIDRSDTRSLGADEWQVVGRLEAFATTLGGDGPHATAASGLAMLYRGDVDLSLELLQDAVYLAPKEPSYWCDLAAASLARGRPTDLLQALDSADAALALRPDLEAALFDRALALERLGLLSSARDAWSGQISGSGKSGWAEEARTHLSVTERRLVKRAAFSIEDAINATPAELQRFASGSLDDVRRVLEDELLPRLGATCLERDRSECLVLRAQVRRVAQALAVASPDRQSAAIATELSSWDTTQRLRAAALVSYGQAMRLYNQDQVTQSAEIFKQLAAPSGYALAALRPNAGLYQCFDAYLRSDHSSARACLARIEAEATRQHYTFLSGRIHWLRAQISLTEGSLARAADEFDRSIAFLREAHDKNQAAAVESLRATLLDQLGNVDEAWRDRISALTSANLDLRRRHTLLNSAGRSCLLLGFVRAALDFQAEAVSSDIAWGQAGALVESHLNRAVILQRLGHLAQAETDLATARRQFANVSDARARARFESELVLMEGEVLAESSPRQALTTLQQASSALSTMQFDLIRARAEYAIGVASERIGASTEARAAYQRGITAMERQREPLSSSVQVQSRDVAWGIYERLVASRLSDDGGLAALATVESSRAQVLRRFLPSGSSDDLPVSELIRDLAPRTVIVYFAVLESETVRWTISHSGVDIARYPVDRRRIDYLVRRFRRTLGESVSVATMRAASDPISDLIMPPRGRIPAGTTLVFSPDGPLHDLPFAAVVDAATGRHLIEDYPVAVVPSLRLFHAASTVARARFGSLNEALVVKGRMGALNGQPSLAVLPAADAEIKFVADVYQRSQVLTGEAATPAAFLARAGMYPVVHFTGHAVANRVNPELSRLYLEPSASDSNGWLMLRDLETASFDRTALVVLAACETGAGRIYRGEGVVSLARPFLGKGVAAVVYTLWAVADAPSTQLLQAFHVSVRAGVPPIVALQRAQRDAIARARTAGDRRTWSAFQYVGGVS